LHTIGIKCKNLAICQNIAKHGRTVGLNTAGHYSTRHSMTTAR